MYQIIWEYQISSDSKSEFERAYAPDGAWAELFRLSSDYVSTELFADIQKPCHYLTIDRWKSRLAYEEFLKMHREQYKILDERCANLTLQERLKTAYGEQL